jgi:hypothetical protein
MIAPTSTPAQYTHGAARSLQDLVKQATVLGLAVLLPICAACSILGRTDIARGLAVGLLLGILNSMLLAQRLDRMISGAEGVERLKKVFRANRALRFTLVLGGSAAATQVRGLHMLAVVCGLAFFFVLSSVIYSRGVLRRWQLEEGQRA